MFLELSEQQARELSEVLTTAIRELYDEVAHADHREYREALKSRLEHLEAVQRQLENTLAGSEAYA
ncbi:MAG: hypothetical protein L0Y66_17075 [Myxococcaceae bacterium]|nr:hypothetical protein [Myxococcaceae bacterium]MCI0672414.1 hypothetical protein [Myxococcaceae bacterium]